MGPRQRVLLVGLATRASTALGTLAEQLDYYLGVYSGTPLRQFNALPGNYVLEARFTLESPRPHGRD